MYMGLVLRKKTLLQLICQNIVRGGTVSDHVVQLIQGPAAPQVVLQLCIQEPILPQCLDH